MFSSAADGEWLTIDGVSAPFDVAKFGATAATCDGPAVGGEDTGINQSDISGAVFVFRRQTAESSGGSCPGPPGAFKRPQRFPYSIFSRSTTNKKRFPARAVVEKVLEAQGLGAIACIIVHNCYAFFAPKADAPVWPLITIPVPVGAGARAISLRRFRSQKNTLNVVISVSKGVGRDRRRRSRGAGRATDDRRRYARASRRPERAPPPSTSTRRTWDHQHPLFCDRNAGDLDTSYPEVRIDRSAMEDPYERPPGFGVRVKKDSVASTSEILAGLAQNWADFRIKAFILKSAQKLQIGVLSQIAGPAHENSGRLCACYTIRCA